MNENNGKKLKEPNAAIVVVSVILCIILVAPSIFIFSNLYAIKIGFGDDSVKKAFRNNIEGLFRDELDDFVAELSDVRIEDISDEENEAMEELSLEIVTDVFEYYITGEGDPVNKKEIIKYIKDNKDELEEELGVEIDKDFISEFENEIDEVNKEIVKGDDFGVTGNEILEAVRTLFTKTLFNTALIVMLVSILGIFGLFNIYIDKSFAYMAVTTLVTGLLILFEGVLEMLGVNALIDSMSKAELEDIGAIMDIFKNTCEAVIVIGGVIIGISIVCFILKGIFRNIRRNREFSDTRSDLEKALES